MSNREIPNVQRNFGHSRSPFWTFGTHCFDETMSFDNARQLVLVHRSSGNPERSQALGPYRIETLLAEAEEGAGTAYRVRIEPGQQTSVSYHEKAEEFYFVIAGQGTALLNGEAHALREGDFLRLPPGTTHGFITADVALDMLNIHIPGCRPNRDVFFVGETPEGFGRPGIR